MISAVGCFFPFLLPVCTPQSVLGFPPTPGSRFGDGVACTLPLHHPSFCVSQNHFSSAWNSVLPWAGDDKYVVTQTGFFMGGTSVVERSLLDDKRSHWYWDFTSSCLDQHSPDLLTWTSCFNGCFNYFNSTILIDFLLHIFIVDVYFNV